jgi:protein-S-isoprenylcysteine O-methyltransferase Ste14
MFIDDFIDLEANRFALRQRKERKARTKQIIGQIFASLGLLILSIFCFFNFAIFAWTGANIPAPMTDENFPLPSWVWTAAMWYIAAMAFMLGFIFLIKALNNLYNSDD